MMRACSRKLFFSEEAIELRFLEDCPAPTRRSIMMMFAVPLLIIMSFAFPSTSFGQAPPSPPPVITFTLNFPASNPPHYAITVNSNGRATYECTVKIDDTPDPETYHSEFQITPANRDRIFQLAKQAKFFSGKVDSGKDKIAFTGDKTLSYQDGQHSSSARYNYSSVDPVRQLTALFQNLQSTLDYGRRLAYYHRYQKLALDEELKRMETQARDNELGEIQAIAPILQELIDDTSVMNVVRARAKEIILMSK